MLVSHARVLPAFDDAIQCSQTTRNTRHRHANIRTRIYIYMCRAPWRACLLFCCSCWASILTHPLSPLPPANPKDKGKQKSKVPQASKTLRDKREQKRKAMPDGEECSDDEGGGEEDGPEENASGNEDEDFNPFEDNDFNAPKKGGGADNAHQPRTT